MDSITFTLGFEEYRVAAFLMGAFENEIPLTDMQDWMEEIASALCGFSQPLFYPQHMLGSGQYGIGIEAHGVNPDLH